MKTATKTAMKKSRKSKPETVTVCGKTATITRHDRNGCESYRVRWWEAGDGKPERRELTATSIEAAKRKAESALKHHESGAGHVMRFSPKQAANITAAGDKLAEVKVPLLDAVTMFVEAAKILKGEGSIIEAARFYMAERRKREIPDISVPDLVAEFLIAKKQDGCSQRYLDDARLRLKGFKKAFGGFVGNIGAADLDEFLRGLGGAPRSRHNVHTIIRSLFSFARSRGYLPASDKTAAEIVGRVKLKPSVIGILKPEEFAAVLKVASPKTLPAFVLGGFCGLRQAEIFRLDWSAVDFKRKLVTVNAGIAKTARRRLVPLPDAAAAWLEPVAEEAGRVIEYSSEVNLSIMMRTIWEKAVVLPAVPGKPSRKVKPSQNCLRHSAASYRLALTGDAPRTALELGNSPKMLMEHYRELVTEEDAAAWFSIMPEKKEEDAAPESKKVIHLPRRAA